MSNLKKEVMNLISRFDAAQEAFSANSADVKALQKKHKKELKDAKAEAKKYRIEVEALKAEIAIMKMGTPAKAGTKVEAPAETKAEAPAKTKAKATTKKKGKRGPGRPKKAVATVIEVATTGVAAEEGEVAAPVAKTPAKRGPGRPKKGTTKTAVAKKPRAAKTAKAKSTGGTSRRPGRPRTKPVVEPSALEAIKGVGPAMARQFEAAGVKTPAAMAKLSNVKMKAILENCGPRYRNADDAKMQTYRDAAMAAK